MEEPSRGPVARALERLVERAEAEVPDSGVFEPIVERCPVADPRYPVGSVTLRIGPGHGDGEARRFFDVRIATASGGSDSSTWVHFAHKAELLELLRAPETGIDATLRAIDSGIESLLQFELK